MLLTTKLKKLVYVTVCLWIPVCIGMESPTKESIKGEEEQKALFRQLPRELIAYVSTFLTSGESLDKAIRNIKAFALTHKATHAILNNPAMLGSLIEYLSIQHNADPVSVVIAFNTPAAYDWLKSYWQKNPQALSTTRNVGLVEAIERTNLRAVKVFLDAGATPNIRLPGYPLLFEAIGSGDAEIVALLLKAGADPYETSKMGDTSLIKAASGGTKEIVQQLLDAKVGINDENTYGLTALMAAAMNGHTNIVKLLLSNGADPNKKYRIGQENTALAMAKANGYNDIVKLLEEAGATN
jgi:hypothetical protein